MVRNFLQHYVGEQGPQVLGKNGKPVVYTRRWHMLAIYCLGYFIWSWKEGRQVILATEYAAYFDTTTEFNPPEELGIDFLKIFENILLIIFYPISAYLVDNYGIRFMLVGAVLQAISGWWWYLSFDSYFSVLASRAVASFGGTLNAVGLLQMTNLWFPDEQRTKAMAAGVLFANFGSGAGLIVGPMFRTSEREVNLNLKSCLDSFKNSFNSTSVECSREAEEAFCCVADNEIDLYNLFLAILATVIMVYALCAFRELPPTAPSGSGTIKDSPGFWKGMKHMFSKCNYSQICLADFIGSGPPMVLYATIDRILPASVQKFNFYAAAGGVIFAIPAVAFLSHMLTKRKNYYTATAALYTSGFVIWCAVTVCYVIDNIVADYATLGLGAGALICFILWTVSVYDLKLEYVYSQDFNISGYVVGIDRTIINFSAAVYLAAIPPERFGDRVTTFYIGAGSMALAVLLVYTIRGKYVYLRKGHEEELKTDQVATYEDL